ncbi:MAG: hypothetical protein SGI72_00275 [Planctomycetota bacterium]|nr:hypothetical protein [Planctomycetota bacterium]
MRITTSLLALACVSLIPQLVHAQDSVSKLNTIPGDAIDPHDPAEQINDYVLDLTSFRSSWNTTFAVGPVAKSSQQRNTSPQFFTGQLDAQTISRKIASNVAFARSQYSRWTAAGFGVNDIATRNDPGTPVLTTGFVGGQFTFGFSEFANGDGAGPIARLISTVGGIVNFQTQNPSRLYVSRIMAAENGTNDGCSIAAFGMGAIDELGNLHFRADAGNTILGCPTAMNLAGNNLFRVNIAQRTAIQNVISGGYPLGADTTATTWLLAGSSVVHTVPNIIPSSVAGRPILIGPNFTAQYVYEDPAGTLTTAAAAAHLAGPVDHRGAVAYSLANYGALFPGTVSGTAAIIAGPSATGSLRNNVSIFGLDAVGNFVAPLTRTIPAAAPGLDPDQPTWAPSGDQEYYHYFSQTAFVGGTSQIALGRDQAGKLLAAGVVHYGFTAVPTQNPGFLNENNYILVAKIDPATGATTHSAAAWTNTAGGKDIYQNGTTVIGRLRPFGAAPLGTTMSGPMIDSVGNVWFIGVFERNSAPGAVSVGLFRAVLNPANFSYRLELVLAQGDTFAGRNSARNYRVRFLAINDSNSVASGTAWSSNISEVGYLDQPVGALSTSDARTLGGLVIQAGLVYDNDQDGQFNVNLAVGPTPPAGTHIGPDEDYNVLLYVTSAVDCNANGIPDDTEIADGLGSDVNGNNVIDACEGIVGTPFCSGDVVGTTCVACGNNGGAVRGCGNSSFAIGARLLGGGTPSVTSDSLTLNTSEMSGPGLFFQANGLAGSPIPFGDGMLCAAAGILRLGVVFPVAGAATYPGGLTPNPITVGGGPINAADVKHYQCWYRDAIAFCTVSTFNTSNGVSVTWAP